MLVEAFVTVVAVTPCRTAPAPSPSPPALRGRPAPAPPEQSASRSDELYSLRARRRFAAYLRMRLLEMREAGLERAAEAVERRLPVDELLKPPP